MCCGFSKTIKETVIAYVDDLRSTLNEGSIMSRKVFLNTFIRRINIRDSEAEIEYTCPIGLGGNLRNEVLSMGCIGSRGRTRRLFPIFYKEKNSILPFRIKLILQNQHLPGNYSFTTFTTRFTTHFQ